MLAFFGALNRGILVTAPNLQQNLIKPLRRVSSTLTIFCAGLDAPMLDGKVTCKHARQLLECGTTRSEREASVREKVTAFCSEGKNTTYHGSSPAVREKIQPYCRFNHRSYSKKRVVLRAMTALYFEQMVSDFLRLQEHAFDVAVVCGPDFWAPWPFDVSELLQVARSPTPTVMTAGTNDGWVGYTDGFYVGQIAHVAAITGRMLDYHVLRHTNVRAMWDDNHWNLSR